MEFDFRKTAKQSIMQSDIMEGRKKLYPDEITERELTITDFDIVSANRYDGEFGVVVFLEYPSHYYVGGYQFTRMCKAWAESFGNIKEASNKLKMQGGIKIRFEGYGITIV